jgi:hypothetical protein
MREQGRGQLRTSSASVETGTITRNHNRVRKSHIIDLDRTISRGISKMTILRIKEMTYHIKVVIMGTKGVDGSLNMVVHSSSNNMVVVTNSRATMVRTQTMVGDINSHLSSIITSITADSKDTFLHNTLPSMCLSRFLINRPTPVCISLLQLIPHKLFIC